MNQNEQTNENVIDLSKRFVLFELGNEILSIPLRFIQEVLDIEKIHYIPKISNKFYGVISLRGEIIPIMNFSNCLFKTKNDNIKDQKSIKILVLRLGHEIFGFVVDKIHNILEFTDDFYENIPTAVQTKIPAQYLENILNINGTIVKHLNIKKIVADVLILNIEVPEEKSTPTKSIKKQPEKTLMKKIEEEAKLKLEKDQLDAIREIINIATGKAAIAMSKLFKIKTQIGITIDQVLVKELSNFEISAPFKTDTNVLGIRAVIENDLDATIFLILPLDQLPYLLENMEGVEKAPKTIKTEKDLDQNMHSALTEFGNIIISHYCSGLSDFLKIQIYHDVPQMAFDNYGSLIDGDIAKAAEETDEVLFLQAQIHTREKTITGAIIFIPDHNSIKKFIEWIDVDTIVELLEAEAEGKTPQDLQKVQTQKVSEKGKKKSKPKKDEEEKKIEEKKKTIGTFGEEIFTKIQFQKDYLLAELDKKDLHINEGDLDTFRELGNIGAGNAGNALSQMLNKKVYLEIPPAKVLKLDELTKDYENLTRSYIGYIGSTKGFFEANIFLIFDTSHIENVLQLIMESEAKKTIKNETDLTATEKSAVIELLNILLGHYIAAMSDFLKSPVDPPIYTFFFKRGNQLFNQLETAEENRNIRAIVVETSINVPDSEPMKGQFIMLLHPNVVERVIERIQQIW